MNLMKCIILMGLSLMVGYSVEAAFNLADSEAYQAWKDNTEEDFDEIGLTGQEERRLALVQYLVESQLRTREIRDLIAQVLDPKVERLNGAAVAHLAKELGEEEQFFLLDYLHLRELYGIVGETVESHYDIDKNWLQQVWGTFWKKRKLPLVVKFKEATGAQGYITIWNK